jgi:drug/metabolite transporter (DMT)-like permease
MQKKFSWSAHLSIFAANIVFGLNFPISKSVLADYLDAYTLSFLRMAFAAAAFWLLVAFTRREKVPAKDVFMLALASLFGVSLNQLSFIVGLSYTASVDASIVITLTPVLTMCLAAVFLKEPISWMKAGGVAMGMGGALIVILGSGTVDVGSGHILGNILCLCSSLSYAIYLNISKSLVARYSSVTVMSWMFLFSAITVAPVGLQHIGQINWQEIPVEGYLKILYVLAGATFLTYLCIGYSLRYMRPTTLSMYNYVQPLVVSFVAVIIGTDTIGWYKIIAAILIFAGVYFVTRSRARIAPYK